MTVINVFTKETTLRLAHAIRLCAQLAVIAVFATFGIAAVRAFYPEKLAGVVPAAWASSADRWRVKSEMKAE